MMTAKTFFRSLAAAALCLLFSACDSGSPAEDGGPAGGDIPQQTAYISGTAGLCNADSQSPMQLHVVLPRLDAGDSVLQSFDLKAGETFTVKVDHIGVVCLDITAPSYQRARIYPILLRNSDTIQISSELRPYFDDSKKLAGTPAVIGDFNAWNWDSALVMQPNGSGTWQASIPLPQNQAQGPRRYQLIGVVADRSINGTQSAGIEYDGAGDYYSVLDVPAGAQEISVEFDESQLPFGSCEAKTEQSDAASQLLLFELAAARNLEKDLRLARQQSLIAGPGEEVPQPSGDVAGIQNALKKLSGLEANIKRIGLLHAGMYSRENHAELMRSTIQAIGASSPLWTIDGRSDIGHVLPYLMYLGGMQKSTWNFVKSIARSHPVDDVRARTLFHLLTYANRYPESKDDTSSVPVRITRSEARDLYSDLLQKHTNSPWLLKARDVNPDRKISPRAPAPAFALPALQDSSVTITVDTVQTPYVLFHFWEPTNQSSIRSVSAVSDVLRIVGSDSLMIISVAVGTQPEAVDQIRRTVHPMPWTHSFVNSRSSWAIETLFNIGSYPNYLLVARDGTIMADNAQFRNRGVSDIVRNIVPGSDPVNTMREQENVNPGPGSAPSQFSPFNIQRRGTPMPRRR